MVIVVQIPRHTITAAGNGFEEAIRDVFAGIKRELEKIRDKRASHDVRITAPRERGVISRLFREEGIDLLQWRMHRSLFSSRRASRGRDGSKFECRTGRERTTGRTVNPVPSVAEYYADKGSLT